MHNYPQSDHRLLRHWSVYMCARVWIISISVLLSFFFLTVYTYVWSVDRHQMFNSALFVYVHDPL